MFKITQTRQKTFLIVFHLVRMDNKEIVQRYRLERNNYDSTDNNTVNKIMVVDKTTMTALINSNKLLLMNH